MSQVRVTGKRVILVELDTLSLMVRLALAFLQESRSPVTALKMSSVTPTGHPRAGPAPRHSEVVQRAALAITTVTGENLQQRR